MDIVAGAVLQTALQELANFLEKEAQYGLRVTEKIKELQTEHRLNSKFIDDVRKLENKSEAGKEAMIQLWEAIYEAHNVLTDCIIRYEYRKDASWFSSLLHHLYDPFLLHQTGKELENINSKMKQKQGNLSRFVDIKTGQGDSDQGWRSLMSQDTVPEIVVGLKRDLGIIKGWMFENTNEFKCIAIVGMGGLGKTTIAQQIYHDTQDCFDRVAWVTVSKSFDTKKISKCILMKLKAIASEIDGTKLMGNLKAELKDRSCLVVLDDVWQIADHLDWWTNLCSYFSKNSCIIITTRNDELPGKMGVKSSQIHRPKTLNEEESWSLFSEIAFSSSNVECQYEFKEVGGRILSKCGGLPLAIKIIGSLLKNKTLSEWEKVLKSYRSDIDQVKNTLRLSFDDLPGHLKHCLLRLSIYPEDHEINATSIIHWWIAEGLVEIKEHDSSHHGDQESSVMKGYSYLLGLMSRCLIEAADRRQYDGMVTAIKIHDMVREMIISIAEEEGFCSFNDQGTHIWKEDSYWLGFMDEMDENWLKGNSNKLRVLMPIASRPVNFDKNSGFLLSLRVLDFSGVSRNLSNERVKDLFAWIGSLRRLACLNLSGAEAVLELPSTIGKLLNLQLLILRGCTKLEKIDASITRLRRLIVLDMAGCPLRYFPQGIKKLTRLQELMGFKVTLGQAKSKCCRLHELTSLTELRVLSIVISTSGGTATISEHEQDILKKLGKLKVLVIDTDGRKEDHVQDMVDSLGVPPKLQELYLRNYCFKSMPEWFDPERLQSLHYLCIEKADIVHLRNDKVESDSCQSGWKVRGLSLKCVSKLQLDWNDLGNAMPRLEYVGVSYCSTETLKNFPCSVDKPADYWRKKQG